MVDKSWGGPPTGNLRVRSNLTQGDRAAERAAARELRVRERTATAGERLESRAAAREAEARRREQAREQRRDEERRVTSDPHADAARRPRSSGRKDVVREQRDTRTYATIVDLGRMRELARRGASVSGLAAAFGVTVAEVEAALAGED
ncbi:hypothetical protein [Sphingomonas sp. 1P08PE]|uniref:hypothetical protein n=1 Tax=Sphingomonas sp. 1P08PE TaxID=554122 RepID=UPI0039A0EB2A